jgi:ABC-type antimicrobial peptide transport system permease subunit
LLGLMLAAIGIYCVTAYSIAHRTTEIGVRVALGARPIDVFHSVVLPGVALAAAGTIAGLAGAAGVARLLGGAVLGVNAYQPSLFAAASAVLFIVAALATLIPARRAMLTDPVVALRSGGQ